MQQHCGITNEDIQKQLPTGKTVHSGQPIVGLSANLRLNRSSPQSGKQGRSSFNNELEATQPIIDISSEPVQEETGADCSRTTTIGQICEEHIQLFTRCEEYIEKENELQRMIEELEKELEETKMKCAKLSLHLESKKKLKLMKQQTQKVRRITFFWE